MVKGLVTEQYLKDVGDAIRSKRGTTTKYTPAQMASVIQELPEYNLQHFIVRKTSFNYFFSGNKINFSAPLIDVSRGTSFEYMFYNCSVLGYSVNNAVPLYNTSNGTSFMAMFRDCPYLNTIPQFDMSNGTNFSYMFYGCTRLRTVPLINTSNGTTFSYMFYGCSTYLTSVPSLNTSSGKTFTKMFSGCTSLETVPVFDLSAVTSNTANGNMFENCTSLSDESLNNILASLATRPTPTSATYSKLSYVGLSETQAQTCTTLSNWAALAAAGWTTGY